MKNLCVKQIYTFDFSSHCLYEVTGQAMTVTTKDICLFPSKFVYESFRSCQF